jgi:chromosome segregation ATPase
MTFADYDTLLDELTTFRQAAEQAAKKKTALRQYERLTTETLSGLRKIISDFQPIQTANLEDMLKSGEITGMFFTRLDAIIKPLVEAQQSAAEAHEKAAADHEKKANAQQVQLAALEAKLAEKTGLTETHRDELARLQKQQMELVQTFAGKDTERDRLVKETTRLQIALDREKTERKDEQDKCTQAKTDLQKAAVEARELHERERKALDERLREREEEGRAKVNTPAI